MWVVFACGSALFIGITTILAKEGIRTTDSTVATALRTVVVLVGVWGMVLIVSSQAGLAHLDVYGTDLLVLSGLATGAPWLCYFKALQPGNVSGIVPIDKLGTVLMMLPVLMFLRERMSLIGALGVVLIVVGILLVPDADDLCGPPWAVRSGGGWLPYVLGPAFFAVLAVILGKIDTVGVEFNLGIMIHTGVVLVMAWVTVIVTGRLWEARAVPRGESGFVLASGIVTYAPWLCCYRVLRDGPTSVVAPTDKLSVLVIVLFSAFTLREAVNRRYLIGLALLIDGTLITLISRTLLTRWHSVQCTRATQ